MTNLELDFFPSIYSYLFLERLGTKFKLKLNS